MLEARASSRKRIRTTPAGCSVDFRTIPTTLSHCTLQHSQPRKSELTSQRLAVILSERLCLRPHTPWRLLLLLVPPLLAQHAHCAPALVRLRSLPPAPSTRLARSPPPLPRSSRRRGGHDWRQRGLRQHGISQVRSLLLLSQRGVPTRPRLTSSRLFRSRMDRLAAPYHVHPDRDDA